MKIRTSFYIHFKDTVIFKRLRIAENIVFTPGHHRLMKRRKKKKKEKRKRER